MINVDRFRNKKVTVIGLARSGLACANLLYDLGADVIVSDNQDTCATRLASAKLKSKNIRVELGRHTPGAIKGQDLIVVSPGVTNASPVVAWAQEFNIPLISEIEVAWSLCPACIIAVTGSSGKTTVATLIGRTLEASGRRAFVCGNIGNPFCAEVASMSAEDFVSLEVSSFQLERIKDFKPRIAVMLNFSRNHLDRHKDMEEYLTAKKRIFMNQDKTDFLVLNGQEPLLKNLIPEAKAKVIYFYESEKLNPNQSAVLAVASILGLDSKLCLKALAEFKGLEHRMEYVAEIDGIKFINDSKATTLESTAWALKNISSPVILIAGGKDKGVDYGGIIQVGREKIREVILIGQAREKIEAALKNSLSVDGAATLEEAVRKAFSKAKPGDS
ncbi:MAG: UDP-N-acetylmuramoyl-L-alanine--D-glutamate ligase, partial [Deltaproteobacteria bacterium]